MPLHFKFQPEIPSGRSGLWTLLVSLVAAVCMASTVFTFAPANGSSGSTEPGAESQTDPSEPGSAKIFGVVKSQSSGHFLDNVLVTATSGDGTEASSLTYASSISYEGGGYQHGYFELFVEPGTYQISITPGPDHRDVLPAQLPDVEVTDEESRDLGIIELEGARGIGVEVRNNTFSGWVAGATVTLTADGSAQTAETDSSGYAYFADAKPESSYSVHVTKPGFDTVEDSVAYGGSFTLLQLAMDANLRCEPDVVNSSLTNMGFEDGLAGWTLGYQTEGVHVSGADEFTEPWEGESMVRVGRSRPSNGDKQELGPNVLCQDFVATADSERLAFNIFTYDYTGFDEFNLEMSVLTDDGDVLASYTQGSWGDSGNTDLKTSGWRTVNVDTSSHVGETLHLAIRAGGTQDDLFAFWVYLDSADEREAAPVATDLEVESATGSIAQDPVSGQYTVAFPASDPSDLTMTFPGECADGVEPSSVTLIFNGTSYPTQAVGPGHFSALIPVADIGTSDGGPLVVQVSCDGETTQMTKVGQIVLYDPSGFVTDSVTDAPVVGAEVFLYKVPTWTPKTDAVGPLGDSECHTNESKDGAPWSQQAPVGLGSLVTAASPEISPNVNPFITNAAGYYGWNVATGCWYVRVVADGYQELVSPVVGVPTEVTDLDLELTPIPAPPAGGGGSGGGGGGAAAPVNTAVPTVGGVVKVGQTLTANPGTWNTTDLTFTYQWLRGGEPIEEARTVNYVPVVADLGKSLSVKVTAGKSGIPSATAVSTGSTVLIGDPANLLSPPIITGETGLGDVLSVSDGSWSGTGLAFTYQWFRDGTAIPGATGKTRMVADGDQGADLTARVTAARDGHADGVAMSGPIAVPMESQPGERDESRTRASLPKDTYRPTEHPRLRVKVVSLGEALPVGALQIRVDGRMVKSVRLREAADGVRRIRLPRLDPGKHVVRAVFAGSEELRGSRSDKLVIRVKKANHRALPSLY